MEHDLVARYGGEEFVLLLPGRTLDAAIAQGEALRRAVAEEALAHPASPLAPHVTISVGVAALVPSAASLGRATGGRRRPGDVRRQDRRPQPGGLAHASVNSRGVIAVYSCIEFEKKMKQ